MRRCPPAHLLRPPLPNLIADPHPQSGAKEPGQATTFKSIARVARRCVVTCWNGAVRCCKAFDRWLEESAEAERNYGPQGRYGWNHTRNLWKCSMCNIQNAASEAVCSCERQLQLRTAATVEKKRRKARLAQW